MSQKMKTFLCHYSSVLFNTWDIWCISMKFYYTSSCYCQSVVHPAFLFCHHSSLGNIQESSTVRLFLWLSVCCLISDRIFCLFFQVYLDLCLFFSGLFGFMSVFSSFRLITNSFLLSVYFLSFVGLIVLWFLSDFCVFRLIPVWFLSDFWLISDWFLYDICLILSYFYLSDSVLSLSDNCNCSVSLISFFLSAFCQVWSRFCLVPVYFLPFLSNFFLVFLSLIFKFFFFPSYFVDLKFMKIIFFFETFNL